jgi:hypothetical protein
MFKTFSENRVFIIKKKCCRAGPAIDDNTTKRMRFTCWIIKAINTRSRYVNNYCLSPTTIVSRKHLSVPLYLYVASLAFSSEAADVSEIMEFLTKYTEDKVNQRDTKKM